MNDQDGRIYAYQEELATTSLIAFDIGMAS